MYKCVYKYEIPAPIAHNLPSVVDLPVGAKPLMVGTQVGPNGEELIYLWAEVATSTGEAKNYFMVLATGSRVPDNATYIGSVMFTTQRLVFHVYQLHSGKHPKYTD